MLKLNWSFSFEWGELIQSCTQARNWSCGKRKEFLFVFLIVFGSFWLRGKIEGPGHARSLEAVSVLSWVRKCVGLGSHLR